jgi:hypothetical protein
VTWETPCPARADRQHCTHWYDGGPCCGCHDPADPADLAAGADYDALIEAPTTTKDGP